MFYNRPRYRQDGNKGPAIPFPSEGTPKGDLLEVPILRSPRGQVFAKATISEDNPDRVVFRLDAENTVTFMGLMSHAGN